MKTLFNKFMMAMVAVVMVIGFSAFKMVEKSKSSQTDWYEVGPRSDNPAVLEIKGLYSGIPVEGTDSQNCATDNEGEICALLIEVGTMAPDLTGVDISDLSNLNDVEVKEDASFPEFH